MPAAIAIPAIATAVAGGATAAASIYGAHKQSSAANHAADVQSQSAAQTLQFEKDQAARDQANFESTQHANYDQWAAREGRLSTLGQMVGLPSRNIPAYMSSPASTPTASGGKTTSPADAQAFFQSLTAGKPASPAMLASLEPQLNAAGIQVHRNASGQASKIVLPNGQFVDPGIAFGTGDPAQMKWAWQTGPSGGAPSSAPRSSYQMPMSTMLQPSANLVPTGQLPYQPLTNLSDLVR